jgi:hypothetical protein
VNRPRSAPPDLSNFRHIRWLGGGGFADVFLYAQLRPEREVAIKVLRTASLDPAALRAFEDEGDLMARVSDHSYIVTIYGTDVAPDGRPYLVMEYYPRPHFGIQARERKIPVAEALQVGIRIASAVETAHEAQVLHRDIKPANILVSRYGRPGLTDFGIAGALDGSGGGAAPGVTIPYAPPEVLREVTTGDELGDVYSLGATLYTLLAQRSPFEVPGGQNRSQDIAERVLNAQLPPIGRDDVPPAFELLLRQAMHRDPQSRPPSAAAFGRAMQGIERELGLAPTEFELATTEPTAREVRPDDADATRAKRIQVVDPDGETPPPIAAVPGAASAPPAPARERVGMPDVPAAADTIRQPKAAPAAPPAVVGPAAESTLPPEGSNRRKWATIIAVAVLAVVLLGAVASTLVGGDDDPSSSPTTEPEGEDVFNVEQPPSAPTNASIVVDAGIATVTWDEPADASPSDTYTVTGRGFTAVTVESPPATIPNPPDDFCVDITTTDDEGKPSTSAATACRNE